MLRTAMTYSIAALSLTYATSAIANVDVAKADQRISAEFGNWPADGNRAYRYQINSQHDFRVKRPQLVPTVRGIIVASTSSEPGGLLVNFSMDHVIKNFSDSHAAITMLFSADGRLLATTSAITWSNGGGISSATSAGAAVGKVVAATGNPAAIAVGTFTNVVNELVGKLDKGHNGDTMFPGQIMAMSLKVASAVAASVTARPMDSYVGPAVQGWGNKGCSGGQHGGFPAVRQDYDLTQYAGGRHNDKISSVRIYPNAQAGMLVQFFDNSKGKTSGSDKDDWSEMVVGNPNAIPINGICVPNLEQNFSAAGIRYQYYRVKGNGNLNLRVSKIGIFLPGQWPSSAKISR